MARLVFSGTFERHPGLKIITHHLGGIVPYLEGRVGYGWDQLGVRTSGVDYSGVLRTLKTRPVDHFRRFYADTAMFGAHAATRCGLEFFGADRVLFASDMPFDPTHAGDDQSPREPGPRRGSEGAHLLRQREAAPQARLNSAAFNAGIAVNSSPGPVCSS
jgi:hypothetical protein